MKKTNAMRILDREKVNYKLNVYEPDENITGLDAAKKLGQDPNKVFETLVTKSKDDHFVFVIPVGEELNLKKAAQVAQVKKIEMLPLKELLPTTGYIHGGCSPVGMKKQFKTFIHESAKNFDKFFVSAGKVGMQLEINPQDLISVVDGTFADIIN